VFCCRVERDELQQIESRRDCTAATERARRTKETEERENTGETQEKDQHDDECVTMSRVFF